MKTLQLSQRPRLSVDQPSISEIAEKLASSKELRHEFVRNPSLFLSKEGVEIEQGTNCSVNSFPETSEACTYAFVCGVYVVIAAVQYLEFAYQVGLWVETVAWVSGTNTMENPYESNFTNSFTT